MELLHLRLFVAVVDAGSITAASTVVRLAQPALSRRMQELERELGGALFARTARGVSLTPLGSAFLGHARDLLAAHGRFLDVARRDFAAPPLRVGSVDYGLPRYIHELALLRFADEYPQYRVLEVAQPMHRQPELVMRGELDLGFAAGGWEFPVTLQSTTLLHEPLRQVLLSATHPLARHHAIHLASLSGEQLLGDPVEQQPAFFGLVFRELRDAGWQRGRYAAVASHEEIHELVHQGRGFTIGPDSLARFLPRGTVVRPLDAANLAECPKLTALTYDWHAVWRADDVSPAAAARERLLALLAEARADVTAPDSAEATVMPFQR